MFFCLYIKTKFQLFPNGLTKKQTFTQTFCEIIVNVLNKLHTKNYVPVINVVYHVMNLYIQTYIQYIYMMMIYV